MLSLGGRGLPDLRVPVKYATFDVDGTLKVPPSDISTIVIESISQLKRNGVIVGIASGRALWAGRQEMATIGVSGPSIFSRGATIAASNGSIIEVEGISKETLLPLLTLLRVHSIAVHLDTPELYYSEADSELLRHHEGYFKLPAQRVKTFEDIFDTVSVVRVALTTPSEFAQSDLLNSIPLRFPEVSFGVAPSPRDPSKIFVNITPTRASPDQTIQQVVSMLKIDLGSVISFGDGDTDIPLLSTVGIGIAMGNASDKVKQHAHLIAPSVEQDGIAVVINYLLSIQKHF